MRNLTVTSSGTKKFEALPSTFRFDRATKYVFFDIQDGDVYCTFANAGFPSGSNGHILKQNTNYWVSVEAAKEARFLAVSDNVQISASQFTD